MIRVVAIDASTWWGSLALVEAAAADAMPVVAAEAGILVHDSHSAHLLPMLEHLLDEVGWLRSSVDAYAATRGPGSFTGLRIGLGTIRGLGLAHERPCVGIGTLEAMAEAHGPDDRVRVPLLDAGRGEVYAAGYTPHSSPPEELTAPWVGPPEKVIDDPGSPPAVFGPGALLHGTVLEELGAGVRNLPHGVAGAAARLAIPRLDDGATGSFSISPLYIRPPDAVLKGGGGV